MPDLGLGSPRVRRGLAILASGSLLASLLIAPVAVAKGAGAAVATTRVTPGRTAALSSFRASPAGTGGPIDPATEFSPNRELDQLIAKSGLQNARAAAAGVPAPRSNAVVAGGQASGFDGITHAQQRLAGTETYAGTQFSLEPPDQALCVGGGFVVEGVNTAIQIFGTDGSPKTAPVAINQWLNLSPEVVRTTPAVYGDFTSDPKCYYDSATQRWFVTVLEADVDSSTGAFSGRTAVLLAVSATADPTGAWNTYKIDTTDDGTNGTQSHAGCPCLGDQPLIGADANGFYISTNEFPLFTNGFNGAQIYAASKQALAAGGTASWVHLDVSTIPSPPGGPWYSLQPATTPPGGAFATNTEYFLSAMDFSSTLDDQIAAWALSGTNTLASATPTVSLQLKIVRTQVYGFPPDAQQKAGPMPFGALLGIPKSKLELLAANDDRMNQVVYAGGKLYGAVNSIIKPSNGPVRTGTAYFIVTPSWPGGSFDATATGGGYVSVSEASVLFPAIAVNAAGAGAMTFTLVGPGHFPSAAFATLDAGGHVGAVHLAAAGAGPEDGFSGYQAFGGNRTARWGDYSAAAVDEAGTVWLATEYIPNAPRTLFANWGTFVMSVTP